MQGMGVVGALDGSPHEAEQKTAISLCLGSMPGVEAHTVHVTPDNLPDAGACSLLKARTTFCHCIVDRVPFWPDGTLSDADWMAGSNDAGKHCNSSHPLHACTCLAVGCFFGSIPAQVSHAWDLEG